MPLVVVTHNGQPPAKGGKRIGYAYSGLGYFPDIYVVAWTHNQAVLQAKEREKQRAGKTTRDAAALAEYNALPLARDCRNACAHCGCSFVYRDKIAIGSVWKDVITCQDCHEKTRPRPY